MMCSVTVASCRRTRRGVRGGGGGRVNIVTYCVVLFVGLLSAGGADPSVEMHFKVLLCTEQENILYLY